MRVYLVRHSHPADAEYDDDPDPDLDDEGIKIAQSLGKWMVENDEVPTMLYASPMTRAQQTAELVAKEIEDAGYAKPEIVTDTSIGPEMSIKGLVEQIASDDSLDRVGIVSHHETIEHGLRVLAAEPGHPDMLAQGELRALKVKRKKGTWKEKFRVLPSDRGQYDNY